jgi:RNA polymerase sigma-70 factor (ECF subfamily)
VTDRGRILDAQTLGDHVDRLYRAAWAMCGSRDDAEDLVQDTFARVLAKPRRVRNDDDIGYLLQALRNTFISTRRAAGRRIAPVPVPDGFEPPDLSSTGQPEQAARARELFAVIASLKDVYRDALVAVDVVGLSYGEAAVALQTKEATITSRVYRARMQVAAGMESPATGVLDGEG